VKRPNPTKETYEELNRAYQFFNRKLFNSELPRCVITLQRKSGAGGFYDSQRFNHRDGKLPTDEIALNPRYFKGSSVERTLSVLVHEMTHQLNFVRTNKRKSYHDRSWAGMMKEVGLYPSSTGQPGGKETGWRMSHYIVPDGPFQQAAEQLIKNGCKISYVEVGRDAEQEKKKKESKTKYTCSICGQNAWAKPGAELICGVCFSSAEIVRMEAETSTGQP
jgi:predicted SprT family Zn-dependent metalloprotease